MGKICEVCQKGAMSGHNVSHSNRKSNRVWLPNTQRVRVNVGGAVRHMNVCTRCLRSGKDNRIELGGQCCYSCGMFLLIKELFFGAGSGYCHFCSEYQS